MRAGKSYGLVICIQLAFGLNSCFEVHAQHAQEDSILRAFTSYQSRAVKEKVYVQTDKDSYLQGEVIWFKLDDLAGNHPSELSRVAYVELLNDKHIALLRAKIALDSGTGTGSFMVPASLSSGNYIFRAYTAWMKNFSPEYFFHKSITIVNTLKRPNWPELEKKAQIDISFFPEGGKFVEGIQGRLAFRVRDEYGQGLHCRGALLNENNDTLVQFESFHAGVGSFLFAPLKDHRYQAVCLLDDGRIGRQLLPIAEKRGTVMRVEEESTTQLRVSLNSNLPDSDYYLFIYSGESDKKVFKQQALNGKAEWIIANSEISKGISHFVLISASRQQVAERLYGRLPEENKVKIKTSSEEYAVRSRVDVELESRSAPGKGRSEDLSISVILVDSIQGPGEMTKENYLWLSSELEGRLESPNYYFQQTDSARRALDYLLLTQPPKKINWDEISSNHYSFNFLPEYEGNIISGTLINTYTKKPEAAVMGFLSVPGKDFHFSTALSDSTGKLHFVLRDVYGPGELVAQTNSQKDSLFRIELDDPFSDQYASYLLPRFELPATTKPLLAHRSMNEQIQTAFNYEWTQEYQFPQKKDSMAFYGEPDKEYYLDDYTRFHSLEEVIREYVVRVHLRKERSDYLLEVDNIPYQDRFHDSPLILLDGVPIFDVNKLMKVDPLMLKKIEVVGRKYYYGDLVNSGILSLYSYEGHLAGFHLDPGTLVMDYEGLQLRRIFHAPLYDPNQTDHRPDNRNVLSWMPSVGSDEKGRSKFSFFTSDIPGTYAIIVHGERTGVKYFKVRW